MNEQVLKTSGADVLSSKKKNSKKLYGDGGGGVCKTAVMWLLETLNTRFSFFTGCQKGPQEKMERKWQETSTKL